MFAAATSAGFGTVQLVLALVGGGGLLSAVVAFYKLRPDVNTAAVTQAQGAAETMAVLQRELVADRDAWRLRALESEQEMAVEIQRLRAALETCEQAHGRRHAEH